MVGSALPALPARQSRLVGALFYAQCGTCAAILVKPRKAARAREASSWHMRLGQLVVTPSFWADTSLLSTALLPLSFLVSAGARLRESVAAAPFVAPCAPPKTPTMHRGRRLARTRCELA